MNIFQIILEVLMLAVIAISLILGIKRGGAKSFFKSTKLIIVILVTLLIGSMVVTLCQNWFVEKMFEGKTVAKLVERAESNGDLTFETVRSEVPEILQNLVPMEQIEQQFNTLSGNGVDKARAIGEAIENVLINVVSNVIGYVLAFIIAFILCTVIIFIIEKLVEIPMLKWVNRIAGVLYGVVSAYFTTSTIAVVVAILFGNDFIDGTIITKFIYNIGLFTF